MDNSVHRDRLSFSRGRNPGNKSRHHCPCIIHVLHELSILPTRPNAGKPHSDEPRLNECVISPRLIRLSLDERRHDELLSVAVGICPNLSYPAHPCSIIVALGVSCVAFLAPETNVGGKTCGFRKHPASHGPGHARFSRPQTLNIDDGHLGGTGATGAVETLQAGYGPAVEVAVSTNGGVEWSSATSSESTETTNESSRAAGATSDGEDSRVMFEYHPPIVLGGLYPRTGPAIGGTLVSISLATSVSDNDTVFTAGGAENDTSESDWQFSFDPVRDASAKCFFNGTTAPATVVSNTTVECVAPPTVPNGGVTFVTVSVNGAEVRAGGRAGGTDVVVDASVAGRALEFFYLPDQAEMSVFPPSGPVKGGTLVEVSSRHIAYAVAALFSHEAREVSYNDSGSNSTNSNSYFPSRLPPYSAVCSFSTDGNGTSASAVLVAASALSFQWDGIDDAHGRETGVGRVLCQSPPAPDNVASPVTIQLSLNGGSDFTTNGAQFYYRPEPYVFGVEPTYGPVTGGNAVRVEGAAFRHEGWPAGGSDEMVRCRFGDQEVGATVHAAGLLSCRAPPMPAVPEQQDIEVRLQIVPWAVFDPRYRASRTV